MTDVGLYHDGDHRYFANYDGQVIGPLTSITTAIKAVDKSGPLIGWAKRETAACAVRNLDTLRALVDEGGASAAVSWLKNIPDHKRDSAADLGTRVHHLADRVWAGDTPAMAEDERPRVEALIAWRKDYGAVINQSEYAVCSLRHGYAGTGDINATIGGHRWAIDIKTGGAYAETGLQLAAAVYADFSGRRGDPVRYRVPPADRFAVLQPKEDGTYAFVPYAVTQETFAAFLDALRLWRWLQGEAKSIVGPPLVGGAVNDMEGVAA